MDKNVKQILMQDIYFSVKTCDYHMDIYFLMPEAIGIKNQMEPNQHGHLHTVAHNMGHRDFLVNKHWEK